MVKSRIFKRVMALLVVCLMLGAAFLSGTLYQKKAMVRYYTAPIEPYEDDIAIQMTDILDEANVRYEFREDAAGKYRYMYVRFADRNLIRHLITEHQKPRT